MRFLAERTARGLPPFRVVFSMAKAVVERRRAGTLAGTVGVAGRPRPGPSMDQVDGPADGGATSTDRTTVESGTSAVDVSFEDYRRFSPDPFGPVAHGQRRPYSRIGSTSRTFPRIRGSASGTKRVRYGPATVANGVAGSIRSSARARPTTPFLTSASTDRESGDEIAVTGGV